MVEVLAMLGKDSVSLGDVIFSWPELIVELEETHGDSDVLEELVNEL